MQELNKIILTEIIKFIKKITSVSTSESRLPSLGFNQPRLSRSRLSALTSWFREKLSEVRLAEILKFKFVQINDIYRYS